MSMPHSSRSARIRIELAALGLALSALALPAWALKTDRQQPLDINAQHFSVNGDVYKFEGVVTLRQGSINGASTQATAYRDANTHAFDRVVLDGHPAQLNQTLDDGSNMHATALHIEYTPDNDTVILTGDAQVVQTGHGEFQGERLVYNTQTGAMQGESAPGGEVHVTFQPRPKKPAVKSPAAAASSGKPGGGSH